MATESLTRSSRPCPFSPPPTHPGIFLYGGSAFSTGRHVHLFTAAFSLLNTPLPPPAPLHAASLRPARWRELRRGAAGEPHARQLCINGAQRAGAAGGGGGERSAGGAGHRAAGAAQGALRHARRANTRAAGAAKGALRRMWRADTRAAAAGAAACATGGLLGMTGRCYNVWTSLVFAEVVTVLVV